MISKRKLNKLLGKELQYTAIYKGKSKDKNRALLLNVEHKGKEYTDHVWVKLQHHLISKKPGTKIKFSAVAYMYNDKKNRRKQGLDRCRDYETYIEHYEQIKHEEGINALARISRKEYRK